VRDVDDKGRIIGRVSPSGADGAGGAGAGFLSAGEIGDRVAPCRNWRKP
jgi:hypothetical protein